MSDTLTLYKLIILFMLNKVDFPLTKSHISEFILGEGYTTFFKLQQALSEMEAAGQIYAKHSHNRTFYHLTPAGRDTIKYFAANIAPETRAEATEFLKQKERGLREESSVMSNYRLTEDNEFEVQCRIMENDKKMLELKLIVPTKAEAESVAGSWTSCSQEIYSLLLSKLL